MPVDLLGEDERKAVPAPERLGRLIAADELSLEIRARATTVFLGPSGAGKTTTRSSSQARSWCRAGT
jgi:ABC-type branched-subunit amino acid transport system ATPase component